MFGRQQRREPSAPCEGHPHLGQIERERTDLRVVTILSLVAVAVAVGLWFYTKDREMVASDGTTTERTTTERTTTGSGPKELPVANTPVVPPPSPPQR